MKMLMLRISFFAVALVAPSLAGAQEICSWINCDVFPNPIGPCFPSAIITQEITFYVSHCKTSPYRWSPVECENPPVVVNDSGRGICGLWTDWLPDYGYELGRIGLTETWRGYVTDHYWLTPLPAPVSSTHYTRTITYSATECAPACLPAHPMCDYGAVCNDDGSWSCRRPDCPVILDIGGKGFSLTDAANGVRFDMGATGRKINIAWTARDSGNAFLVLDRNGNGIIDNGKELFGNYTSQPPSPDPNGFLALTEFDKPASGGNENGLIDEGDAVFPELRLWDDSNHNGLSEPEELFTLRQVGVVAIDLKYKDSRYVDPYGNQFRFRAKIIDSRGAKLARWAYDVFLTAASVR